MGFTFYVDGDNAPKQNIHGIEKLDVADEVVIFYANNNPYYAHPVHQDDVRSRCKCPIQFISVKAGNNAVDFAVAMYTIKHYLCNEHEVSDMLFMISGDEHFEIIKRQLSDTYEMGKAVEIYKNIADAYDDYALFKIKDKSQLLKLFEKRFGATKGSHLIASMTEILYNQDKTENKGGQFRPLFILQRLKGR